jgi:hypothetical protein
LLEIIGRSFCTDQDFSLQDAGVGHWSDRAIIPYIKYGKLHGHHGPPEWGHAERSVYIYRRVEAVAASLYNSKHFRGKSFEDMTFSEFIRAPLDWIWSTGFKLEDGTENIVEHWMNHTKLWHEHIRDNRFEIVATSYLQLLSQPRLVVERIANRFWLPMPYEIDIPREWVGHFPSKGGVHGWRKTWSEEDLKWLATIKPAHFYI